MIDIELNFSSKRVMGSAEVGEAMKGQILYECSVIVKDKSKGTEIPGTRFSLQYANEQDLKDQAKAKLMAIIAAHPSSFGTVAAHPAMIDKLTILGSELAK